MAEEEARGIGKARHNGVHEHQGCADVEGCGPRAVNGWCHEGDLTIATSNPKENGKKAEEAGNQCNGTALPLSCACAHEALIDSVIRYMDNDIDVSSLSNEAVKLLKLIPEGYIPVPHQVGGHRHVDGKFGFLRRIGQPEILFKPVQPGAKGLNEVIFYDKLFNCTGELHDDIQKLKDLVPRFIGCEKIRDRADHLHEFLKLEDITHHFRRPAIMDVKIGKRVWDDYAEQDKIERERKKYPDQEVIGFRIIGMRVFRPKQNDYVYYDRFYGRSVTADTALSALNRFFEDGSSRRLDVIDTLLEQLVPFLQWAEKQRTLKLFASSLLIVYEGDTSQPVGTGGLLKVKLVDFAHAYEKADEGLDENSAFGMRIFMSYLRRLREKDI
ncbi:hypothetical protein EMCRGX_G006507 [Ephydatia muelleri]